MSADPSPPGQAPDPLFQVKGDQLLFLQATFSDRVKMSIVGLIAVTVLSSLGSLPLLLLRGTSLFFWGLALLSWGIFVAAIGRMLVALVTDRGIVFDRNLGTALVWRTRLGRRRETVHSLRPFDSLHLRTWMQRVEGTKGSHQVQVYALELRGPQESLRLEEIPYVRRYGKPLAEFLRLPLVVEADPADAKKG